MSEFMFTCKYIVSTLLIVAFNDEPTTNTAQKNYEINQILDKNEVNIH